MLADLYKRVGVIHAIRLLSPNCSFVTHWCYSYFIYLSLASLLISAQESLEAVKAELIDSLLTDPFLKSVIKLCMASYSPADAAMFQ